MGFEADIPYLFLSQFITTPQLAKSYAIFSSEPIETIVPVSDSQMFWVDRDGSEVNYSFIHSSFLRHTKFGNITTTSVVAFVSNRNRNASNLNRFKLKLTKSLLMGAAIENVESSFWFNRTIDAVVATADLFSFAFVEYQLRIEHRIEWQ